MINRKKAIALEIVKTLRKNGFQAYFAGGCIRDMIMKNTPDDYDIATDANPAQIKKLFKKTVFVGAQFGTVLVVKNGISFEVTTFRGKKVSEFSKDARTDALNRDITINGLFYDPVKKKIIDYCGGMADIKKKLIRCISNPVVCFKQDRLRPLRAIRIAANLGFEIEPRTFSAIKKFKDEVNKASSERIRDQLIETMTGKNPYRGLQLLDEAGLLAALLPEIEKLKGVQQPPKFHPEGDAFVHTTLLIKALKNADIILAFACLLHDIGKPSTFKITDRIRFNGHDKVGAAMAQKILKKYRFSNEDVRKITYCIDNHMRIMNAKKMREATLKKMFLKDTFETELELHRLDCLASHSSLDIYNFLKRKYAAFKRKPVMPTPVLNGHEIIKMGFKEGPVIGKIHRQMIDLQLEGKIKSKEAAKKWIQKKWIKTKKR